MVFGIDYQEVIQKLLKDPEIQNCRLRRDADNEVEGDGLIVTTSKTSKASDSKTDGTEDAAKEEDVTKVPEDIANYYEKMERDDDDTDDVKTVSFEVNQSEIENLQKRCIQLEYPLLAEYDFKNDTLNPDIK